MMVHQGIEVIESILKDLLSCLLDKLMSRLKDDINTGILDELK